LILLLLLQEGKPVQFDTMPKPNGFVVTPLKPLKDPREIKRNYLTITAGHTEWNIVL